MQNIGIAKLVAMFEEVVAQTWESAKEEESEEEQRRKLQELNYNSRVREHIKSAVVLAGILYNRYSAPVTEGLTYSKALEFSNILQKAYKGELEPI